MGELQIRNSARRRRQALAIWCNGLTNPGADQVSWRRYSLPRPARKPRLRIISV